MKITTKTLQVNFEHDVTVGNGAIEATLCHTAWISEDWNGKICVDLDFADVKNVRFMGMPIEDGYRGYEKFRKSMSEIGIDVVKMFDKKAAELITDGEMKTLRNLYKTHSNV